MHGRAIATVRRILQQIGQDRTATRSLEHALQLRAAHAIDRVSDKFGHDNHVSAASSGEVGATCSLRCSTFVCRFAGRDEVFLMNTLTDAQLVVSSDVAALLDRSTDGADVRRARPATSARRSRLLRENGFLVAGSRRRIGGRSTATSRRHERHLRAARHGPDHAPVQLRVRLLLPGRSRRLQQVRREDVARDRGARRRLDRARARSRAARER